jgi:hypothetical protein
MPLWRRVARLRRIPAGLAEEHAEMANGRENIDGNVNVDALEVIRKDDAFPRRDGSGPFRASRLATRGIIRLTVVTVDEDRQPSRVNCHGEEQDTAAGEQFGTNTLHESLPDTCGE